MGQRNCSLILQHGTQQHSEVITPIVIISKEILNILNRNLGVYNTEQGQTLAYRWRKPPVKNNVMQIKAIQSSTMGMSRLHDIRGLMQFQVSFQPDGSTLESTSPLAPGLRGLMVCRGRYCSAGPSDELRQES